MAGSRARMVVFYTYLGRLVLFPSGFLELLTDGDAAVKSIIDFHCYSAMPTSHGSQFPISAPPIASFLCVGNARGERGSCICKICKKGY